MRILVIEDEKKTATYLHKGLTEAGFVVDVAADGPGGLHLATTSEYDLVVCDVMLPRMDGLSVVESMRCAGMDRPVIFLTARDSIQDRVRGLDAGADDYLVKPFSFSELLARVRSLLRRRTHRSDEVLRVGDLELDPVRHLVTRAGRPIALTAREFSLLALFMRRRGEVLTRTVIAEQIWDMNFDSDSNVIDVAVGRLRQKIEAGFEIRLIHTVRGMGYVLREPA